MHGRRHESEPRRGCDPADLRCAALTVRQLSQERVGQLAEEIWARSTGGRLPASPVPDPRATKARSWLRAMCTTAATSSVLNGKHTTAADPESTEASRPYSPSSTPSVRTRSGPNAARRSAARAARSARSAASSSPARPGPVARVTP